MGVCLEANFLIFLLLTSSFIVRSPSKRQRESHKSETLKEVNEASPNNNDRLPYPKTETRVTRACDTQGYIFLRRIEYFSPPPFIFAYFPSLFLKGKILGFPCSTGKTVWFSLYNRECQTPLSLSDRESQNICAL